MTYGRGRAEQFRLHPTPGSALNFVPPLFCLYLLALPIGLALTAIGKLCLVPLLIYALAVLAQAGALAAGGRLLQSLAAIPLIVLTHVLYGLGFWRGLFTPLRRPGQRPPGQVVLETGPAVIGCFGHEKPGLDECHQDLRGPAAGEALLDLLAATSAGEALQAASAEQARILAALFAGSQALGNLLVARPDWLSVLEPEALKFPRRKQGLRNEVNRWLKPLLAASDYGAALTRLREFKQREMLRIAARDLARLGKLAEILQEISDVADVCLDARVASLPPATRRSSRPDPGTGCRRALAADRRLRAWHGQTRRAGAQLQLGRGCDLCL